MDEQEASCVFRESSEYERFQRVFGKGIVVKNTCQEYFSRILVMNACHLVDLGVAEVAITATHVLVHRKAESIPNSVHLMN